MIKIDDKNQKTKGLNIRCISNFDISILKSILNNTKHLNKENQKDKLLANGFTSA